MLPPDSGGAGVWIAGSPAAQQIDRWAPAIADYRRQAHNAAAAEAQATVRPIKNVAGNWVARI